MTPTTRTFQKHCDANGGAHREANGRQTEIQAAGGALKAIPSPQGSGAPEALQCKLKVYCSTFFSEVDWSSGSGSDILLSD